METSEIISLLFGVLSAPVGLWIQSLLLRKKYNAEIESLRAQVEASKTDTRGDELENVKNGMSILMEQVVEPLKKEINAIRKELARLRRAVEKANRCPFADHADACRQCGAFALQYVSFLKGGAPMDIEVKRMSPTAIEMLDQLSAVCKRFGVDYYAASQNQRDLLDSIALHEYQLKKAHEQELKRSEVPPFLGLKRSDRSNDMPA